MKLKAHLEKLNDPRGLVDFGFDNRGFFVRAARVARGVSAGTLNATKMPCHGTLTETVRVLEDYLFCTHFLVIRPTAVCPRALVLSA